MEVCNGFIVRTSRTTTISWTAAALLISDYAAPLLAVLKRQKQGHLGGHSLGIWGHFPYTWGHLGHARTQFHQQSQGGPREEVHLIIILRTGEGVGV